ncbi:putative ribonuclease H-like domain-containing protein, partial [Tanacetum coccineum]
VSSAVYYEVAPQVVFRCVVDKFGGVTVPGKDYILLPFLTQGPLFSQSLKDSPDARFKPSRKEEKKDAEDPGNKDSEVSSTEEPRVNQGKDEHVNSINNINTVSSHVNAAGIEDNVVNENIAYGCDDDPNMHNLEEIVYSDDDDDVGAEADIMNLDTHILVSPIPTTRIHKDNPVEQIIRDIHSAPQTRRMTKNVTNHIEPKKKVWTLVDLPYGKRAIGTKWVYRNKKDERGSVIRNKARLVAQGYTQEEGIDYDEVFAPVARIEAIRLFLAYASYKDFVVYQMDKKSAFLYGKIEEEVYICQPPGFEDLEFPNRVYKVKKALYGLHQAPRSWYETLSTCLLDNGFLRGQIDKTLFIKKIKGDILLVQVYVDDIIFRSIRKEMCTEFEKMMHKKFQMSSIGELTFFLGLQVTQKDDGIFISQDKYVDEILKKFGFLTIKTASTPMETSNPLLKDAEVEDVDVHLYKSMIGSLMYLTASRPDIMFVVCAYARFQVIPKVSHLHVVKRIFRYLKGQPKLGLWYPKDSLFDLEAYTDSDYAGASLDRKFQMQTVVANSTTEAEYVAASSCCRENPVFHSKTKHIEIRHHFIRDSNEKKLIQMIKIHTDQNVADLLTKAFDVSRFQYLIANEAIYKELSDSLVRVATTASSLEAEQDSGNITKTRSKATPNEVGSLGTTSGGGPRCQDTILGGTEAQIRFEAVAKQSNDLPLLRVNILGSGEDINAGVSKLMLLSINLLLPVLVYAARHTLTAVRHKLILPGITYYCWFWATAKAKTVNGQRQIQALVDKKKVIITETSVRSDLKLEDAEGTECLLNDVIFEQLTLMGYENLTQKLTFYIAYFSSQWKFLIHTILQCLSAKTTAWNEFSSTMASAIICLATNQNFNFSKYIFDNMMKNLEGGVKFLMYPRFVQVFLDKQVKGISKHKGIYVTPSHTKKVFANMKRPGKGFSGKATPLFQTMMVQTPEDMGEDSAAPTDSHPTPIITQPSSSKPQKKQSRRKQRKGIEIPSSNGEPIADEVDTEENEPTHSNGPLLSSEDRLQLNELMEICTNLQKCLGAQEDASKQGRKIADLDADAEVTLIDETQGRNNEDLMFDTGVLDGDEVFEEPMVNAAATTTSSIPVSIADPVTTAGEVVTTASVDVTTASAPTTTIDELTLAQTLIEIKAAKPKAVTTAVTTITLASTRPKAKGIVKDKDKEKMVEPEKPLKKKDQIAFDEEVARNLKAQLQAELEEEERLARQKEEEANIALIKSWDNTQAMMDVDFQLCQQMQAEEQELLSIKEK